MAAENGIIGAWTRNRKNEWEMCNDQGVDTEHTCGYGSVHGHNWKNLRILETSSEGRVIIRDGLATLLLILTLWEDGTSGAA